MTPQKVRLLLTAFLKAEARFPRGLFASLAGEMQARGERLIDLDPDARNLPHVETDQTPRAMLAGMIFSLVNSSGVGAGKDVWERSGEGCAGGGRGVAVIEPRDMDDLRERVINIERMLTEILRRLPAPPPPKTNKAGRNSGDGGGNTSG